MKAVKSLKDIERNAFLLADILASEGQDRAAAASLIKKGTAFFPFYYEGRLAFAPSRFIGYKDNSITSHSNQSDVADGKVTNRIVDGILGFKYVEDEELHKELVAYANRVGVALEKKKHRFWPVESAQRMAGHALSAIDDVDDGSGNDDPDYKRAMRGSYKRDPAVRKAVLKRAGGKCEYCGSSSFVVSDGTSYLETHHVIALAKQGPDRVGNVIALCANHHREAHFGEDWKVLQVKFLQLIKQKAA